MRIRSKEDLKFVSDEWLKENAKGVIGDLLELIEDLEDKVTEIEKALPKEKCSCGGYRFPLKEKQEGETYLVFTMCGKCYKKSIVVEID
jgi:hypothetical protein